VNHIDIIDEHLIIRETVGYEVLNQVPIEDMPKVIEFLKIVYNYNRMKRVVKEEEPGWSDPMIEHLDREEKDQPESIIESSWMDQYYDEYRRIRTSGMMFEFYPTFTGEWHKDKYAFCYEHKKKDDILKHKVWTGQIG